VAADFPDAMYSAVGARVGDRAAAFGADVVLKVRPPAATDARPGASPPGLPIGDEPRRSPPGGGGGALQLGAFEQIPGRRREMTHCLCGLIPPISTVLPRPTASW